MASDADALAAEAASLDGYFSDAPLTPEPQYPPLNESFDTAIVITNLPTVGAAKIEKLTKVVTKLVSRIGALAASDDFTGVYLPIDEAKDESFGFAICEYATKEEARQAVEVLQGYKVRAMCLLFHFIWLKHNIHVLHGFKLHALYNACDT